MDSEEHEDFEEPASEVIDEWDDFGEEECDPISVEELKRLNLRAMPEGIHIWIMDNYFPETIVSRDGEFLICEILYRTLLLSRFETHS